MSRVIQHHPRCAEWRALFRAHPEWFVPWEGTFFRFQTVDFPTPRDVLAGRGAARRGGRWNPPGLHALYGSTTDSVALEECKANDRYYGLETKSPRLLVAVEACLIRVLKLTDVALRRKLGLTLVELASEDWRKLQEAGQESLTQGLGRAVAQAGGSGLLVPSASVRHGVNAVVFPGSCRADRLAVVEAGRLDRLFRKTGA